MTQRLYPEAIRGLWFLIPEETSRQEVAAGEAAAEVLVMRLDGSFRRLSYEGGQMREREHGDYTFDGDFLITRGRSTETYRVRPQQWWRWEIETKKDAFELVRSLDDLARPRQELGEEAARDLRILPLRADVEPVLEDPLGLVHLTFSRAQDPLLGVVSVEVDEDSQQVWLGIGRVATELSEELWARLAQEVVCGVYLEDRGHEPSALRVRWLETSQEVELELD